MWSLCIRHSSEVVYRSRFYYKKVQRLGTVSLFGQTRGRDVVSFKTVACHPSS